MSRFALLSLIILAAGCGQKGPLYFAPTEAASESGTEATQDTMENDQTDDEGSSPAELDDSARPVTP